jgi:hypothetical protein
MAKNNMLTLIKNIKIKTDKKKKKKNSRTKCVRVLPGVGLSVLALERK